MTSPNLHLRMLLLRIHKTHKPSHDEVDETHDASEVLRIEELNLICMQLTIIHCHLFFVTIDRSLSLSLVRGLSQNRQCAAEAEEDGDLHLSKSCRPPCLRAVSSYDSAAVRSPCAP